MILFLKTKIHFSDKYQKDTTKVQDKIMAFALAICETGLTILPWHILFDKLPSRSWLSQCGTAFVIFNSEKWTVISTFPAARIDWY